MEALLLLVEPGWGAGRVFKKIVDVFFSLNIFAMKHIGSFNVFKERERVGIFKERERVGIS
jgi:hypothetical protein